MYVKVALALAASSLLGVATGACLSITADTPATNFHYQAVMQSLGSRCKASEVKCVLALVCRLPLDSLHLSRKPFCKSLRDCSSSELPLTPANIRLEQRSCDTCPAQKETCKRHCTKATILHVPMAAQQGDSIQAPLYKGKDPACATGAGAGSAWAAGCATGAGAGA